MRYICKLYEDETLTIKKVGQDVSIAIEDDAYGEVKEVILGLGDLKRLCNDLNMLIRR